MRGALGPAVSDGVSSGSTDSVAVDGATEGVLTTGLRIVMIDDAGGRTGNDGCAGARKPCMSGGGIMTIIGGGDRASIGIIGCIGVPSVGHAFEAIEKPDVIDATDGDRCRGGGM